jgi:hypothetical protein
MSKTHVRGDHPFGGMTLNMGTSGCFFKIFLMYAENGLLNSSLLGLNTGHCSGADPIATRTACCLLFLVPLRCLLSAANGLESLSQASRT